MSGKVSDAVSPGDQQPSENHVETEADKNPDLASESDSNGVRRPNDSRFHQQRLPAWQPLLTAQSAFPLFFVIGILFIPLGAVLFTVSQSVEEIKVDYTNCKNDSAFCLNLVSTPEYYQNYRYCQCSVSINLERSIAGQVYVYYALTNFYQNHRRYVRSRDDSQLQGAKSADLNDDCEPFRRNRATGAWYAPCGAIANSLFNDTFELFYNSAGSSVQVPWTSSGIAWDSDRARKFARITSWNGTEKPPNWPKPAADRSPTAFKGDEELIVWMRTAALPSFRKLHRIVQHDSGATAVFRSGLPAGNYTLRVNYAYPVSAFAGTKSFVLTTSTWLGGKNPALGIIYLVVGCVHIVLGFVFVGVHVYARKKHTVTLSGMY